MATERVTETAHGETVTETLPGTPGGWWGTWRPFWLAWLLTVVLFVVALPVGSGVYETRVPLVVLFPFAAVAGVASSHVSFAVREYLAFAVTLGLLGQWPLYALIARFGARRGRGARAAVAIGVVHLAAMVLGGPLSWGPSLSAYRRVLRTAAGPGARDCGVRSLGQPQDDAVACARASLAAGVPFSVAFQVIGTDSTIYVGLAYRGGNAATRIRWDSDVSGGFNLVPIRQIHQEACPSPTIGEAAHGPLCRDDPGADGASVCEPLLTAVTTRDRDAVARAALDAPARCVDLLAPGLARRGGAGKVVVYALAIMAQPRAQDLLYDSLKRHPDSRTKVLTASSAAAVGRPVDIEFLCEALDGEVIGPEWFAVEAAALSLALLQSARCRSSLERVARTDGHAGLAARHALQVMATSPPCRSSVSASDAVLACAVPRTEEARAFYQANGNTVWWRAHDRWSRRPARPGESDALPALTLSETQSAGGKRALVRVGLSFGLRDGSGYLYSAVRRGGEWRVVAVLRTWIS